MIARMLNRFRGGGLSALVLRGSAVTTLGFGVQTLTRLGGNLILTRLLAPEVFGVMALATVVMMGLNLLSDLGTKAAIVRSPRGEDPVFLRTAWTVQVIRGFLIAIAVALLAWPISRLYDQPVLFPVLCALTVTVMMGGFASISIASVTRKISLTRLTLLELLTQTLATLVTIVFAWILDSVWALAIGAIAGAFLRVTLSHVMLPAFRHRLQLEPAALSEMIHFGRWILLGTLLTFLGGKGAQAIQGLLVPIETLGFLVIAAILSSTPTDIVIKLFDSAGFPAISEVARARPQDLRRVLRKLTAALLAIVLPGFFLLALIAEPLIELLYDPRYIRTADFLALMALNGALTVIAVPYQATMLAMGNSRMHALVMACFSVFQITGLLIGFYLYGEIGMLVGTGVGLLATFFVSAGFAYRSGFANIRLNSLSLVLIGLFYALVLLW